MFFLIQQVNLFFVLFACSSLRKDLDELKENGLPESEVQSKNESYCARCQTFFGILINRGAYCPRCELKVCKICRVKDVDDGWICTLCSKVRYFNNNLHIYI